MTDQIQTQQSSGESTLPWFNSLGNPWSIYFPTGPGQDPMVQADAHGKAKGAVQGQGVSLSHLFGPPVGLTGVLTPQTGRGEQGTHSVRKTEGVPQNPVAKILF